MKHMLAILFILALINPITPQEQVKEEVAVKWWVLPLFAVDEKDISIMDLSKVDIELYMDNKKVEDFTLYRRDFIAARRTQAAPGQQEQKPLIEKEKLVFLLFDTVLSSPETIQRAKHAARSIIADSVENNRFVLFTIEPMTGLKYWAGPLTDKKKIIGLIEKEVKQKANKRYINMREVIGLAGESGNKGSRASKRGIKASQQVGRLNEDELRFLVRSAAQQLKNRSNAFFRSFGTFYYNINSIKDNKFIYLFSEGLSKFQHSMEDTDIYRLYLRQVGEYLGRCGAVVFIINAALTENTSMDSLQSGKDSMLYLAQQSGGKYIQGPKEVISEKMNQMHRAYYEIAFADLPRSKGDIHKIKIKSKRKGVTIHTLGTVERSKSYARMNDIEKEILVLNLISQNPLYETGIESQAVNVLKQSQSKGKVTYKIKLPEDFLNKQLDLYKVAIDKKNSRMKLEKEILMPRKQKCVLQFTAGGEVETDFVLLDGAAGKALIEGPGLYGDLEAIEPMAKGKALSDDAKYRREMEKYLAGAADYCKQLKQAAFHYFCREKVVETYSFMRNAVTMGGTNSSIMDISQTGEWSETESITERSVPSSVSNFWKVGRKYEFDYQVISRAGKVAEQRKLLSKSSPEMKLNNDRVTRMIYSFIAERAVFGPVTLLAEGRQEMFNFRLLKFEKHKGRFFAVIEALPKVKKGGSFGYGKVWIDTEDYSVRRIELDPRSIQGYENLLKQARRLRTRLYLACRIEYDRENKGIRFPTSVLISEKYKGGPVIIKVIGNKTWERSRKEITYTDYRFFDVAVEVKETKIEK